MNLRPFARGGGQEASSGLVLGVMRARGRRFLPEAAAYVRHQIGILSIWRLQRLYLFTGWMRQLGTRFSRIMIFAATSALVNYGSGSSVQRGFAPLDPETPVSLSKWFISPILPVSSKWPRVV